MNRKLILLMTSLSLTVALPFQTAVYASESATIVPVENRASLQAATGEYRSWKQGDSRWGSMHLGSSSDTMAESGCLVTAIAMLMVHTGCADESDSAQAYQRYREPGDRRRGGPGQYERERLLCV